MTASKTRSNDFKKTRRKAFAAVALWGLLLAVLSLEPDWVLESILPIDESHADLFYSLFHVTCYGILGFLLCLFFRFKKTLFALRMTDPVVFAAALTVAVVWGGAIEWAQVYSPTRIPDWVDFGANVLGALGGLTAFGLWNSSKALPHKDISRDRR
ncbi:MAG: VanZ family protein [Candidatus Omnitrophota bacterium]|nr:VanZ family protein [Candidatus Omnitrophota bacterium]